MSRPFMIASPSTTFPGSGTRPMMESAVMLFRGYPGSKDQYLEEALLAGGKREEMLCLQFGFGRGEVGEIRLTYVDNRLVQKQQNGIW